MRAAYFLGDRSFEIRREEIPAAGPGEVVIRNMASGVCGTDVHIYHGDPGSADVVPPVVLGHEYAGEIVAVGEGVDRLAVGDHVTVDPNMYCGECVYCRTGKKQLCENMKAVGVTQNGGFAEYSVVPAAQAFRLDPAVPFEYGAMAEPTACCLRGIDRAGIRTGDTVLIVGGGAIGLILLQLARLSGAARICVCEPNAMRRGVAMSLGADGTIDPVQEGAREALKRILGQDGADVVIECAGNNAAVQTAFDLAAKGARIVLFSVPKVDAKFPLPLFDVYRKELTICGSFVNPDTHERAVRLINAGRIDFGPIITHRFPLEQMEAAVLAQMGQESVKVIVEPQR